MVSLRGISLVLFIAELNGLESWGTDTCNTYLEAFTKEKFCIVDGPGFRPLEVHNLIIVKSLCGLRTSGLSWHERLADCLQDMGFEQCNVETDIWLLSHGEGHYELISVCSDHLLIASKDPKSFVPIKILLNSK